MKTKLLQNLLLLLCLYAPFVCFSQITLKVTQSFPAHIIYKINKVASKIKLNEEQQMKIGLQLVKIDSIATATLHRGDDINSIKRDNISYMDVLKTILTPEELENYLSQIDKKNRFLIALKWSKKLQLNSNQIEQIRLQNNILNTAANNDSKKEMAFYTRKLDSILKKPQYATLIKIIYASESREETREDWDKILKLKLATPKDSSTYYPQIYQYHLTKNAVLDKKAALSDEKKSKELKEKIDLQYQPKISIWYAIATNGDYKNNIFSQTIKYQKELNLTGVQIDSLLANYKKIEQIKYKNKFQVRDTKKSSNTNALENIAINKILDYKQITLLLYCRNQKTAGQMAINDWKTLEKMGLTKDLDKETTIKEFANYQLKYLVADDRVKMDKNKVNIFYRRDILLKKPPLLIQLDAITQAEQKSKNTKNELRW